MFVACLGGSWTLPALLPSHLPEVAWGSFATQATARDPAPRVLLRARPRHPLLWTPPPPCPRHRRCPSCTTTPGGGGGKGAGVGVAADASARGGAGPRGRGRAAAAHCGQGPGRLRAAQPSAAPAGTAVRVRGVSPPRPASPRPSSPSGRVVFGGGKRGGVCFFAVLWGRWLCRGGRGGVGGSGRVSRHGVGMGNRRSLRSGAAFPRREAGGESGSRAHAPPWGAAWGCPLGWGARGPAVPPSAPFLSITWSRGA